MIERCFDAQAINKIANHPAILPWISESSECKLDLTAAVENDRNVTFKGEHGAMIYDLRQPGLYEVHTMVLPEGRGKWTLKFVQDSLKWMFCRTGALEIMTRCPKGNLAAKALTRSVHGVYCFTNPAGMAKNGRFIAADVYNWTIQHWMQTAPDLIEQGRKFLTDFPDNHPDYSNDEASLRQLGAIAEMMAFDQNAKAMIFYRRWSAFAQYPAMFTFSQSH